MKKIKVADKLKDCQDMMVLSEAVLCGKRAG